MRAQRLIRRREAASSSSLAGLNPVLARLLAARGVTSHDQLDLAMSRLHSPGALSGIAQAASVLADAVEGGKRILIVGDFDADGATSTALSVRVLKAFGAQEVRYRVPNRFEDGYGLTPEIVASEAHWQADVLMTVDNGTTALAGVAAARAAGMRVVVTDHHLAGAELPQADALVNPNVAGDEFPSKHLAGVGVAFYVLSALRAELTKRGWFAQRGMEAPNLARYLDLVALGTVADVVPLDQNNRVLVEQGLKRMRAGQAVPGILSLLAVSGRDYRRIVASDLGFGVGPRLNAAGRMEDMSIGIQCLLADTPEVARRLAEELHQLNAQRQTVEAEMQQQALVILKQLNERLDADTMPRGVCLFDADWHQGVIGILAGRVKEKLHRPTFAFARGDGGQIKGSGRSIPGLHLRDALDLVAKRSPDLLLRFGGHAAAAGVTLLEDRLAEFEQLFEEIATKLLSPAQLARTYETDGALEAAYLSLANAQLLKREIWGQAFPAPIFSDVFEVVSQKLLKEKHLKLSLRKGKARFDAIRFNAPDSAPARIHAAFRIDANEYMGVANLQLLIEYFEPA